MNWYLEIYKKTGRKAERSSATSRPLGATLITSCV
jgi:hypothetical protein